MLNLSNKLESVTDWNQLGLQLEVPADVLERIELDFPRAGKRMYEVLKYWLNNCPKERRSWNTVADALKRIGYKNLAERIIEDEASIASTYCLS